MLIFCTSDVVQTNKKPFDLLHDMCSKISIGWKCNEPMVLKGHNECNLGASTSDDFGVVLWSLITAFSSNYFPVLSDKWIDIKRRVEGIIYPSSWKPKPHKHIFSSSSSSSSRQEMRTRGEISEKEKIKINFHTMTFYVFRTRSIW